MKGLRNIASEIIGLFVDDWAFALLLIAWVGIVAVIRPHVNPSVGAPVLFVGIAALVLAFVAAKARTLK